MEHKMKLLILAANGQIARIVEQRVLTEDAFKDVQLTLGLRNSQRLAQLADNPRVRLVDVDLTSAKDVADAMVGQDIVFVAVVDHGSDNAMTKNVVSAARTNGTRVIATNILGIYNEVPGEFGRWNLEMVKSGLQAAVAADELLANSGLDFTTLRLPWLNDRDDVKYTITSRDEPFVGVSGSRQSVADVVLRIVADPTFAINDSIGLADPDTEDLARPVY
ncbi:oxidoreductase [Lacticaseibacillus sharpeae JCM 1186 = DSM 20505]|uniref:Oxidoreductase n=2 Tax=Lacticaseibacillus sharpeae TaxID=1626 RepID=A0A0R1ZHW2_9LACO|nr:oxidoreductase [Lacticaseibacillus sharpeae JCM 1186 = DSM 20505]